MFGFFMYQGVEYWAADQDLAGFLAGTGFGIYVAQKYEIPDIREFMDNFKETTKKYEKKDDKTS